MTLKDVNYYREYLGKVYNVRRKSKSKSKSKGKRVKSKGRVVERGPGRCSMVVSNHTGFLDVFNLICSPIFPGFTPKATIGTIPFILPLVAGL